MNKKHKEHLAKLKQLKETHLDRLLSVRKDNIDSKKWLLEVVEEAKSKGYTIIPAYESEETLGICLFKEIDGIEIAYNPTWNPNKLDIDIDTLINIKKTTPKELWMDDVGDIALEATELIQKRLKEYNIELKDEQEDEFYVPIFNALENYSNGNYRSEN